MSEEKVRNEEFQVTGRSGHHQDQGTDPRGQRAAHHLKNEEGKT
jgi:hypothetical protein